MCFTSDLVLHTISSFGYWFSPEGQLSGVDTGFHRHDGYVNSPFRHSGKAEIQLGALSRA
jgi:hypothetical protein